MKGEWIPRTFSKAETAENYALKFKSYEDVASHYALEELKEAKFNKQRIEFQNRGKPDWTTKEIHTGVES